MFDFVFRFPYEGEKKFYKFKSVALAVKFVVAMFGLKKKARPLVKIFYATETGTAKKFVNRIEDNLSTLFNIKIVEMNKFESETLSGFCLFVSSTFGNGDPPGMASKFAAWLDSKLTKKDIDKRISLDPIPEEKTLKRQDSIFKCF